MIVIITAFSKVISVTFPIFFFLNHCSLKTIKNNMPGWSFDRGSTYSSCYKTGASIYFRAKFRWTNLSKKTGWKAAILYLLIFMNVVLIGTILCWICICEQRQSNRTMSRTVRIGIRHSFPWRKEENSRYGKERVHFYDKRRKIVL